MLDLFSEEPVAAWQAVPLPDPAAREATTGALSRLECLLFERSRTTLANRLSFAIRGEHVPISDLAVEVPQLEGLLTSEELASLAALPAALPVEMRDNAARWRAVLDDWRAAGADLPEPVSVADALPLTGDDSRPPDAAVALTAAGVREGLGAQLALVACVVGADGHHILPPEPTSAHALTDGDAGLAAMLGMAIALHDALLADTGDARTVLDWLGSREALIDGIDARAVLGRLAAAGQAGNRLAEPLGDDQLRALRDAFEPLGQADWSAFGPGVGRAVLLDAFRFDAGGRKVTSHAHPADAYMPKSIDREPDSFAVAAGTTANMTWLASRYATVLKSSLGRFGLGPQRFLRLLGAETAPRLVPHPMLASRYSSETSRGLASYVSGASARTSTLQELGAGYTLEDCHSPDFESVVTNIAHDRKATRRRQRATAVLATLGRTWATLSDAAEVPAVHGYRGWRRKGAIRAWWLWQAAIIPWLDDASATPTAPIHLRLRTPSTVAVHGLHADGYLHPTFGAARRDVLAALGVAGEPSSADLVDRLRQVSTDPAVSDDQATDSAVVYQALAQRLSGHARLPGDLGIPALRRAFSQGRGLIRTAAGWKPPTQVLRGPPVFGGLRAFVPQIPDTDRLWSALHVPQPDVEDCLDVLAQLARLGAPGISHETVILETLRLLGQLLINEYPVSGVTVQVKAHGTVWHLTGWKKSAARIVLACPARNASQVSPAAGVRG